MPISVRESLTKGGFLDRWLDYCSEYEFPDSYALFSLLACASAAVNGRIVVNPDTEPSPMPNLYVVLYGPSGSRKGSAMRHALWLLSEAVPETPMLPDDFTMEALNSELARMSEEAGKCSGFVVQEEFADLIGGPDYALRNTKLLTKLWDARPVQTRLTHAHGKELVRNPYVVILGSSSPDWLEQTDPRTMAGGFLRRILLIVEYGPKRRNAEPARNQALFSTLVQEMARRLGPTRFKGCTMSLTSGARASMAQWYHTKVEHAWKSSDEKVGHFASCMQAHALKVAALVNVLEGRGATAMTKESLDTSTSLIESLLPGLSQVYASLVPTPYARLRAVILRTVQQSESGGMSDAELDKAVVLAAGVRPKDAFEARTAMLQQGVLMRLKGGRIVVRRE